MDTAARAHRSRRLTLLSTGVALLIALILLFVHQYVTARAQLLDELHTEAAIIGANSTAALVFNDKAAGREILGAIRLTPRIAGAALYRADGRLLAAEAKNAAVFPPHLPAEGGAGADDRGGLHEPGRFGGVLSEEIRNDATKVGTLLLHVDFSSLYRRLLEYMLSVMAIALVALVLAQRFTARLRHRVASTEERLAQLALYDQVTGLGNRRLFELELKKAVIRIRREPLGAALLFIDVDDFKKVNDSCGHEVGDRVLRTIGERLSGAIRSADTVARIGGDEFAAILYEVGNPENAAKVAREMIAAIAEAFPTQPTPSHVGLSIGLAMLPADGDDPVTLLRRADMAMYAAKSAGKNRFHFFSAEIDARVHVDLALEAGLRLALQTPDGGLWVAYQPQLCTITKTLVGVEALARWRRADGTEVSPGEFIPVAEKSGLISALGRWVLSRVCRDLAELRAAGVDIPKVAINVSPRQLTRGTDLAAQICRTLDEHGETAGRFEFELTENALMDEGGALVLDALHAAGFSLAIDDFGTGYSSLGYLKRFQVSKLKIDQRFIRELPDNPDDAAIVSAVIKMAWALDIRVVAEGVETEAQAKFLQLHGCEVLQGYLLGRPMPPAALVAYVRERRPSDA
ncbi:MAG: EAL domain-containing protein [Rhodocyclaceae bacterium]